MHAVCVNRFSCVRLSVTLQPVDSPRPYSLQPSRLLCPWDSPGKKTGVGCCVFLHGIFPTQGSNPPLFPLPTLAGTFFTTSTTWEALLMNLLLYKWGVDQCENHKLQKHEILQIFLIFICKNPTRSSRRGSPCGSGRGRGRVSIVKNVQSFLHSKNLPSKGRTLLAPYPAAMREGAFLQLRLSH